MNLDSALYRSSEIAMIAPSPKAAMLFQKRHFEPDIARSRRGESPSGRSAEVESWLWDELTYFL